MRSKTLKKREKREKKKTRKNRNSTMNFKSYSYSQGFIQTLDKKNKSLKKKNMQWNSNYDGKMANLNIKTNLDGKKHNYHFHFDP